MCPGGHPLSCQFHLPDSQITPGHSKRGMPFLTLMICVRAEGIAVPILSCKLDSQFKTKQKAVKGDRQ